VAAEAGGPCGRGVVVSATEGGARRCEGVGRTGTDPAPVPSEVQAAWQRFSTVMLRLTWRELQREEDGAGGVAEESTSNSGNSTRRRRI
jgi:hypothetical protein